MCCKCSTSTGSRGQVGQVTEYLLARCPQQEGGDLEAGAPACLDDLQSGLSGSAEWQRAAESGSVPDPKTVIRPRPRSSFAEADLFALRWASSSDAPSTLALFLDVFFGWVPDSYKLLCESIVANISSMRSAAGMSLAVLVVNVQDPCSWCINSLPRPPHP